jgi:CRISPR-associated protein Cas1
VHSGTDRSFVYDIADLYKADVSIPAAFDAVASEAVDPANEVRRMVRDRVVETQLIRRAVADIHELLGLEDDLEPDFGDLLLWSELEAVPSGTNWGDREVPA